MPTIVNVSLNSTVTAASQQITLTNATDRQAQRYVLCSTTNCWVTIGTNPTAAVATAGSTYLPAGVMLEVFSQPGLNKLAVIRDTLDGNISATPAMPT